MVKTFQIKDSLHRRLKIKASQQDEFLQDFIEKILEKAV